MINVIENANAPLCEYNLISINFGIVLGSAKLTEYEAKLKNYAFGLNHSDKRYELVSCEDDTQKSPILILPD